MLKVSNTVLPSPDQWLAIIRGARNPMNSWNRADSVKTYSLPIEESESDLLFGESDVALLKRLSRAGADHGKFMRQIPILVDITAPLYWWKEFDQYKVGTTTDSCSTMHKITSKPFELEDFSLEDADADAETVDRETVASLLVEICEEYRQGYLDTGDKKYWRALIEVLPCAYNQTRTVSLNYAVLKNIYHARKDHKLSEWHTLCDWILDLPLADELILGE